MKAGESHSVPTVHFADPPASCVSEKSEKSEVLAKVSQVHEKPLKGPPIASICKLFSLVDFKESLILLLGLLGAIGNGVTQPVVLVVFGDLIDGMGSSSVPVELPANVTPEQMALLMDDAMDGMMSEMERLCIIMCLIGVANTVAATLQGACFKIFSDMQTKKYRVLYFKSVLFQDVSWFDLKEVAALPSEVNDDLEKIGDALGDKLGNGIMSFSAFVGGFGCAFGLGWLVALVMCAMLPFMGVGAAVMGKAVQEIQLESQSWYSKAACVVEECLYAMRTVVAFGGERRELQKFQFALVQTRRGGIRNGFKIGLGLGYTTMIIFAGNALAFWFGMTLRYNDQVNPATGRPWEPGNILAIFFCVFTGSFMIGNLDPSLKALAAARFAAGRFFQVKENRPQVQCGDVDGRKDLESIENFELREVHFSYPARRTCVESVRVLGSFVTVACPIDGHYVKLEECHQDKLAITQINNLVMSCEIKTCTWHGRVWHLEDHMKDFHNGHEEECAKNLHQDGELKRLRQEQQEAARKIMGMEEMLGNQDVTIHNIRRQLSAFSDAFVKVQGHGQLDNKEILTGNDELRQQLNTFKHKVQTLEEQKLHQDGELKRLRQEQQEAARKIMGIEEMEKSTGNVELRQQLSTLQHKVQTLEEQLRVQKDQCGKYHVECVAESGRTCEERNIEVEILQGSISCLTKQLVDVQNKYAALQTSHANLQHCLDALQAQFAFS